MSLRLPHRLTGTNPAGQAVRQHAAPPHASNTETRNAERPAARTELRDEGRRQAARQPTRGTSDERQATPHRTTARKTRPAPRPDRRQAKRGEPTTPEGQRERMRSKQPRDGTPSQRAFEAQKKRRGDVYRLIPVSHHYSMGSGFKEVPTICSTRFSAASLVLKPR